ncbi:hypothetical protein HB774_02645 [Rhizobium leguminosarum bv. viciae]|nr:hypothetical protein HB774_02645 [Rhizobium leguminosarum bv. viciae]
MSTHQLQIRGVSEIDSLKLQNELGEEYSTFEADFLSGGRHGDLGLGVVMVVLTLAALKVVGMYLLRKHKSDGQFAPSNRDGDLLVLLDERGKGLAMAFASSNAISMPRPS